MCQLALSWAGSVLVLSWTWQIEHRKITKYFTDAYLQQDEAIALLETFVNCHASVRLDSNLSVYFARFSLGR